MKTRDSVYNDLGKGMNSEVIPRYLFQDLGWLNIFERIQYHKGILLYKTVNGMCPQYMSDIFTFSNSNSFCLRSIDNQDIMIIE